MHLAYVYAYMCMVCVCCAWHIAYVDVYLCMARYFLSVHGWLHMIMCVLALEKWMVFEIYCCAFLCACMRVHACTPVLFLCARAHKCVTLLWLSTISTSLDCTTPIPKG